MRYRQSMAIRTLTAKYAGTCSCCGGHIPAGKFVEYNPRTKRIAHYKASEGNSSECYAVQCAEMESRGIPTSRKPDHGFVDIDRAYEDQCADICGR